jgi:hypothetical protein
MRIGHSYALIEINKPRSALFGRVNQQSQGLGCGENAHPEKLPRS